MTRLRSKIVNNVISISHTREKLKFIESQNKKKEVELEEINEKLSQVKQQLSKLKEQRQAFEKENQKLK